MKKIIFGLVMMLLCMMIFDIPYYYKTFEREYECLEFVVGQNETEKVNVSIVGSISKYFFNEDKVIRYQLKIGDTQYPRTGDNVEVFPYIPETTHVVGIHTSGRIEYDPTDEIECALSYRDPYYDIDIQYSYLDTKSLDFITVHDGFLTLSKDLSTLCIGLYPEDNYSPDEFPSGINAIVMAKTYDEATYTMDELWEGIK